MNETVKKAAIIVVAVVAIGVAIFQGYGFFDGPKLQYVGKIGNFSKGHTGKQAMLASEKSALQGGLDQSKE